MFVNLFWFKKHFVFKTTSSSMKPYPAIRVANYFIKRGLEEGRGVSPMKVQTRNFFLSSAIMKAAGKKAIV
jgi:uncharacterized phage-associated protein